MPAPRQQDGWIDASDFRPKNRLLFDSEPHPRYAQVVERFRKRNPIGIGELVATSYRKLAMSQESRYGYVTRVTR